MSSLFENCLDDVVIKEVPSLHSCPDFRCLRCNKTEIRQNSISILELSKPDVSLETRNDGESVGSELSADFITNPSSGDRTQSTSASSRTDKVGGCGSASHANIPNNPSFCCQRCYSYHEIKIMINCDCGCQK